MTDSQDTALSPTQAITPDLTPKPSPNPKLAVGIITYRRPKSLQRLLTALMAQTYSDGVAPEITVVVVDNDADATARVVCDGVQGQIKISYVVEPQLGIPMARNRVLDSLPDDCQFLLWIDDDETPEPNWINSLLHTQAGVDADIVMGAVQAILPEAAPKWIKKGGFFNRRRFMDRATLAEGATNNCLMRISAIRSHNLRFDERMRYTGGTDTLFFRTAESLGLRMVWSAEAVVNDHIPLQRCSLRWLVMRHFRSGNTLAICDRKLGTPLDVLGRAGRGVNKLLQSIVVLPLSIEGMHEFARSIILFARGLGMLAGLAGYQFDEYSPKRLQPGLQE
jgi:glycosyltransferase involved in cell wall biosynthesis